MACTRLPTVLTLLGVLALGIVAKAASWEHEHQDKWRDDFPACAGKGQSPIDIVDVEYMPGLKQISFIGYDDVRKQCTMENNGHTADVKFGSKEKEIMIKDGGLPNPYKAVALHFHWGKYNFDGAEHRRFGEMFPIEMHIVHYNTKYRSLEEAVDKPEGLAVLGVWFKMGKENPGLGTIVDNLMKIRFKGDKTDLPELRLTELLPTNTSAFYRYSGSLTTPPCYESVVWTMLHYPATISQKQLTRFRILNEYEASSNKRDQLVNNFRPPQERRGRKVFVNAILPPPPTNYLTPVIAIIVTSAVGYTIYTR